MLRRSPMLALLIVTATCGADEIPAEKPAAIAAPQQPAPADPDRLAAAAGGGSKTLSGMSILGNQEAPKALVIVPWKSSEIGDRLGLSEKLDDSRGPVDREVFMRELDYYDIRTGSK